MHIINDWIAQLRSNQEFYKNTQDAFWQTTVENSSGNARKLWNSISAIMGSKKHSPAVDGLNAGIFLKTFEDKVKDVRASTEGSVPAEYSNFIGDYLTRFSEVSLEDVEMLIRKSSNKSCGLDPAPTWLIRDFAVELAPFICALFNKSLSLGSVPRSFKIADITPVLKKSSLDASVPSNYRPISNLCYLSKLLERIVNNQLVEHLQVNNLMPEHQSAYRRCHSTEGVVRRTHGSGLGHGHFTGHAWPECCVRLRRPSNPAHPIGSFVRCLGERTRLDPILSSPSNSKGPL